MSATLNPYEDISGGLLLVPVALERHDYRNWAI
jgi:hypothetical protein